MGAGELDSRHITVKLLVLLALPTVLVTVIGPLVAKSGTVTLIWVSEIPWIEFAFTGVPLKATPVVPVKLVPVMVTIVPGAPLVGEKELTVGLAVEVTVNEVALVAMQREQGVVTWILPVVAPPGTLVLICVLDTTVKVAETPLKVTLVAPVKVEPVIVTGVPFDPLVGEKELIFGSTVKLVELVALPTVLVTLIGPLVAPLGTLALSWVSEIPLKDAAGVPLKATAVVPVKWVPVMVTIFPTAPRTGEKELIVGAAVAVTVKAVELVAVPSGVFTLILPVVAPPGTLVEICVLETTVKVADVPLKVTRLAFTKPKPLIVTGVPSDPLVGEKELILNTTVKLVELVAVPAELVTVIGPLVVPLGTVALIWVSELTVKVADVPLKCTAVVPVKPVPVMVTVCPQPPL